MTTREKPRPRSGSRNEYSNFPRPQSQHQYLNHQPPLSQQYSPQNHYPAMGDEYNQNGPRVLPPQNEHPQRHVSTKRSDHPKPLPQHDYPSQDQHHRPRSNHSRRHRKDQLEETQPKQRKSLKHHLVASSGELIGTFMFLYFSFSAHLMIVDQASDVSTTGGNTSAQTVVFISLAYGFSLLVSVWGWYRISGGLFNPAVTLGLCLAGQLPWLRGLFLLPSQLLGGMAAAGLVSAMFPGPIATVNTTLAPGVSIVQGLFIEMFLTSLLMFIVLMLAAEKSKDTFIAPIGIGLALFVAELSGVYYTGGSLNPTRSLGPAVASLEFPGYHWIYWLGPLLGAAIAAGYYRFVKYFDYEEANPGQDSSAGEFKE